MNELLPFLSENQLVKAIANAFALITGGIILWKGLIYGYIFAKDTIKGSIHSAYRKAKIRNIRVFVRCATDIHYFLSRALLMIFMAVYSTSGILIVSISQTNMNRDFLFKRFNEQNLISNFESFLDIHVTIQVVAGVSMALALSLTTFLGTNLCRSVARLRRRWKKRGYKID